VTRPNQGLSLLTPGGGKMRDPGNEVELPNVYKHKNSHSMEYKSMLFVTNHIPYLLGLSNSFLNCFIDFYSCKIISSTDIRKNKT